MKNYVLDANAVIRYLIKGPGVEKIDKLFAQSQRGEVALFISVINRGEVLYTLAKRAGMGAAKEAMQTLDQYLEAMAATQDVADRAAALKFNYKLGYGDCFAAELAVRLSATLVTADPGFTKVGKQLKILALPRHSG